MSDIFSGKGLAVLYNADTGNRSPQGVGNVTINDVNEFPTLTIKSETNSFETYDSDYKTVLLSDKSVEPFQIVVNYLPDDTTHQFLDNAAETQILFQVIIQYQLDMEENQITYAIVNGYLNGTQLTGDKESVVTKSYTFTPQDVITRTMSMTALLPISQGDYGVGSNTTEVPQYAPGVPTGNGFIKVPSTQAGNPAGADMMGVGLVDGTAVSSIAMTKTGTLSIYAKNATTAWTRIYTATQMDARYVPLTRTVNGKPLSTNVQIDSTDTASLAIENNLNDVADKNLSRQNLGVYSISEIDTFNREIVDELNNYVQKNTTINDKPLSNNMGLSSLDTGSLAIENNLGDLADIVTSRKNLGLGTAALMNTGLTGETVPLMSAQNTWTGKQSFDKGAFKSTYADPLLIESSSPTIYMCNTDTDVSGMKIVMDGTNFRIERDVTGEPTVFSYSSTNDTVTMPALTLTAQPLAITNGGTGATTAAAARTNLGFGRYVENSSLTYIQANDNTSGPRLFIRNDAVWGALTSDGTAAPLAISYGGTGATTPAAARTNLGLGTSSTYNTGTSGATIPLLSTANTWSAMQTFNVGAVIGSTQAGATGLEIGSWTTEAGSYIDFHSSGTGNDYDTRIYATGGSSTAGLGNLTFNCERVYIRNLLLTNALPLAYGGTGATDSSTARTNLGAFYERQSSLTSTDDLNDLTGRYPGIYNCGGNAIASAANNYPVAIAGSLTVFRTNANSSVACVQTYVTFDYARIFVRTNNGTPSNVGTWSAWKESFTTGTIVPLANGGTGATSAAAARSNIEAAASAINADITALTATQYIDFNGLSRISYIGQVGSQTAIYAQPRGTASATRFGVVGGYVTRPGASATTWGGGTTNGNLFNFDWGSGTASASGRPAEMWIDNTLIGQIQFLSTSDKYLKKDIEYRNDSEEVFEEVKQWKVASFKYKARGIIKESDEQLGFIAQDLVGVSPEVVKGEGLMSEDYNEDNPGNSYSLDNIALTAKLTQAIQVLIAKVEEQQQTIDEITSLIKSSTIQ